MHLFDSLTQIMLQTLNDQIKSHFILHFIVVQFLLWIMITQQSLLCTFYVNFLFGFFFFSILTFILILKTLF